MATVGAKKRIEDEVKEFVSREGQSRLDPVSHCKDFSSYPERTRDLSKRVTCLTCLLF